MSATNRKHTYVALMEVRFRAIW